jgi:hypothetical protein
MRLQPGDLADGKADAAKFDLGDRLSTGEVMSPVVRTETLVDALQI